MNEHSSRHGSRGGSRFLKTALAFVALPCVSVIVVSDFLTGLKGYALAPAAKLFVETTFAVALLLQLVPVLVMLTYDRPSGPRFVFSRQGTLAWLLPYLRDWQTWAIAGCMAVDAVYDATFRTSLAATPAAFLGALVESLVIFTLFSEVLFVWIFNRNVEQLIPPARAFERWWARKMAEAEALQRSADRNNGRGHLARSVDDEADHAYCGPGLLDDYERKHP